MVKTILFIGLMIIIAHFLEKLLRRKLNLETDPEVYKEPVNKWHKWISNLFYITFLTVFIIVDDIPIWAMLTIFCISYQGYKIFMEWKFEKATKEYLLSVIFLGFYGITIGIGAAIDVF
jgi:Domain of unknown function (DUF4181)